MCLECVYNASRAHARMVQQGFVEVTDDVLPDDSGELAVSEGAPVEAP